MIYALVWLVWLLCFGWFGRFGRPPGLSKRGRRIWRSADRAAPSWKVQAAGQIDQTNQSKPTKPTKPARMIILVVRMIILMVRMIIQQ